MDDKFIATLLAEHEQMRKTLANMLQLVKQQNLRIEVLENKLDGLPELSHEQMLLDRFTASSLKNRNLNETPETIAYAAHLHYIKQVPAMRIAECGLLSQSKIHGLARWDGQHLVDFCEVNNVTDVYKNGLDEIRAREITPDYDKLVEYLNRKTQK